MTNFLRIDGLSQIRPGREYDNSYPEGSAVLRVERLLDEATHEFAELRSARPEEYDYQLFTIEEDVPPDAQFDMSILPEDMVEVVEHLQLKYDVKLTDEDVEAIEGFINSYNYGAYWIQDALTLPMNKARQGAITQELVEISSGTEAIK